MRKIFSFVSALFLSATLFAQAGETELFVAANARVDHTWGQFENPEATWNAVTGTFTIEIKAQGEWQWGNQVFLATGITTLGTNKEYQVSFDIVASTADCSQVTFKAFDDNQIAWANQDINVTDQVQRWTSEWTKAGAETTNGLMVWDFGWDPEQTVTITNISIKEREVPAPAPYLFVDGIVTINELKDGETIFFQYFTYVDGKRVNGIAGNTISRKSFEPYTTEGYCEISYTNMDDVERKFITNPVIVGNVDSIFQGEVYLFVDTLLTTAGTYNRMIGDSTATLTLSVKSNAPVVGDKFVDETSGLKFEVTAVGETNTVKVIANNYTGTSYTITDTVKCNDVDFAVTAIGVEAFFYCSFLQSITIPAGVTTIGEGAFYECSSLASVTFLGNACQDAIGEMAFYGVGADAPALLTLHGTWAKENQPDEDGNWYGGKFELSEDPSALPTLFGDGVKGNKFMHNGQMIIRKNDKLYNAVGAEF